MTSTTGAEAIDGNVRDDLLATLYTPVVTIPHPPALDVQRIHVYSEIPDERISSSAEEAKCIVSRYSESEFDAILTSTTDSALSLRYLFQFSSIAFTKMTSIQSRNLSNKIHFARVLDEAESISLQRSSLADFIRETLASAIELVARRFVTAKLNAASSVKYLVKFLFSLQKRIPPPFSTLEWECQRRSLPSVSNNPSAALLAPEAVLSTLTRITDGHFHTQRVIYATLEELAKQNGLSDVLQQWPESVLKVLRPVGQTLGKNGASDESTRKILGYINRKHNLNYSLVRRLDGGFSAGAYLIQTEVDSKYSQDGDAQNVENIQAVLKWNTDKDWAKQVLQVAPIIQSARAIGYPTPEWLAVGTSPSGYPYQIQAFAKGSPVSQPNIHVIKALIPLFELQRDFRPSAASKDWTEWSKRLLFNAPNLHSAILSGADKATRRVYLAVMNFGAPCVSADLCTIDLVHGDLNLGNILMDYNISDADMSLDNEHTSSTPPFQITFVDSEGMGCGCVLFDVTTVLLSVFRHGEQEAFERLLAYAVDTVKRPLDLHLALVARLLVILRHLGQDGREAGLRECEEVLQAVKARCCATH